METLYPSDFTSNPKCYVQETKNSEWSREENKKFESALAIYDKDTPDRWLKVASMIPGKSVYDVIKQYKELEEDVCEIEAGRVPIPGYIHTYHDAYRKRPPSVKSYDQERKKVKYGKGDWRNISRNFVMTKTPTQVASHAQKYFIRQKLGGEGKDKRRPSIHDITIVNHTQYATQDNNKHLVFNNSAMPKLQKNWNQHIDDYGSVLVCNPNYERLFMSSSSVIASRSKALNNKLQEQDLYDCAFREALDLKEEAIYGIHALYYQL
ncbi:transcription factor DIVARICATA-like [Senna tora]|uniref:Transcription factor DIVARICATA-like n=1 Tax=Senna tora TaxID=362788 RepID=A0A834T795_9FABA|nr:transcription factor DIVARICATA-like [Senna tora]